MWPGHRLRARRVGFGADAAAPPLPHPRRSAPPPQAAARPQAATPSQAAPASQATASPPCRIFAPSHIFAPKPSLRPATRARRADARNTRHLLRPRRHPPPPTISSALLLAERSFALGHVSARQFRRQMVMTGLALASLVTWTICARQKHRTLDRATFRAP